MKKTRLNRAVSIINGFAFVNTFTFLSFFFLSSFYLLIFIQPPHVYLMEDGLDLW